MYILNEFVNGLSINTLLLLIYYPVSDWPPWQCDIFVLLLDWGYCGHKKQWQGIVSAWLTLPNKPSFAIACQTGEDTLINNSQFSVSCQNQQIMPPTRNQNSFNNALSLQMLKTHTYLYCFNGFPWWYCTVFIVIFKKDRNHVFKSWKHYKLWTWESLCHLDFQSLGFYIFLPFHIAMGKEVWQRCLKVNALATARPAAPTPFLANICLSCP